MPRRTLVAVNAQAMKTRLAQRPEPGTMRPMRPIAFLLLMLMLSLAGCASAPTPAHTDARHRDGDPRNHRHTRAHGDPYADTDRHADADEHRRLPSVDTDTHPNRGARAVGALCGCAAPGRVASIRSGGESRGIQAVVRHDHLQPDRHAGARPQPPERDGPHRLHQPDHDDARRHLSASLPEPVASRYDGRRRAGSGEAGHAHPAIERIDLEGAAADAANHLARRPL